MVEYLQAYIGAKGSNRVVEFFWQGARHQGSRRVPVVPFIGKDEPGHQDIGRGVLTDSFNALVLGPTWLDTLEELEDELRRPGVKTLSHPVKGLIDVRITRWEWNQKSRIQERADVTIEFTRVGEEIPAVFDIPQITTQEIQTAQEALEADAGSRWNLQNQIDNFQKAAISKLQAANDQLLRTKGKVNARFAVVDQLAFAISDLNSSITSLLNSPQEIAGRFANLTLQVFALVETAVLTPRQSAPVLIVDAVRDMAEFGFDDPFRSRTTQNRIDHDDTMLAINEDVRAFALIGASRALTLVEYDSSSTAARVRDDMALLYDNVLESSGISADAFNGMMTVFTSLSRFLTERVQNLPAITTYTPPETTHILLIAHELYGDSTRADEIVNRNNIRCPHLVPGGIPLEVLSV